jgi:hypothetical protein
MNQDIVTKFVAAAIIQVQLNVISRYRQGQRGDVYVAMTTRDDQFMDLTERAICRLGFDNNDFPPCEALEKTFSLAPCDA